MRTGDLGLRRTIAHRRDHRDSHHAQCVGCCAALLKALGIRIAIDDFGTGYSSLAYLQQLPVDTLKIDRSFISNMADSPETGALIRTLVQGKTLGLETLAEGNAGRDISTPDRSNPMPWRRSSPRSGASDRSGTHAEFCTNPEGIVRTVHPSRP